MRSSKLDIASVPAFNARVYEIAAAPDGRSLAYSVTADPPQQNMETGSAVKVSLRVTSRGNTIVHEMNDPGKADDPAKTDHPEIPDPGN